MNTDSAAVRCRGVRGATFIEEDTPAAILAGTRELLEAIAQANGIATEDIASAFFTSTADLRSAFPARAARELGWTDVPLLGATEVDKPDGLRRHARARSAQPSGVRSTCGGTRCVTGTQQRRAEPWPSGKTTPRRIAALTKLARKGGRG
jgi:chorismate mutase